MGNLSKNFDRHEFVCNGHNCCGGAAPVTSELITALQQLRDLVGEPIIITCGFRCPTHNARTKNAAPRSYHQYGMAADIKVANMNPSELARYAERVPLFRQGGIAIYPTWIHVDVRPDGPWRAK